jgi:hypothetical protein
MFNVGKGGAKKKKAVFCRLPHHYKQNQLKPGKSFESDFKKVSNLLLSTRQSA